MTILVTGGAGYIGSHVVRALLEEGYRVIVLDDLSSGQRSFVHPDARFLCGSVLDTAALEHTLRVHKIAGVIHLAGYKYAGESVKLPLHTYEQNFLGTVSLLKAMRSAEVYNLVFSSSAAVYGTPFDAVVTEQTPVNPDSPYGRSKLAAEWIIKDQAKSMRLNHVSLRYFNVVGSGSKELYDTSPHNLFPRVIKALRSGELPTLYGGNYPTPDGTAIRDYIHVSDLAEIHVEALLNLKQSYNPEPVYNIGSGVGFSVLEVFQTFKDVTGIDFKLDVQPRRLGDPQRIVATGQLAARDLGWIPQHSLEDMVSSAWEATVQQ